MSLSIREEQNHPDFSIAQGTRLVPLQLEFVSRFFGGARYIGMCIVTFEAEGFSVEGNRVLNSFIRYILLLPYLLMRLFFFFSFTIRPHDRDYVFYSDIIKIKRYMGYYYLLAFNSKGKRHWYCMKIPKQLREFMTWIDLRYFPQEENPQ